MRAWGGRLRTGLIGLRRRAGLNRSEPPSLVPVEQRKLAKLSELRLER